jgi:peptide/nickel transport system ATP-binding protein
MTEAERTVLDIRNLDIAFQTEGSPVHAVNGVSLSVGEQEIVALVGESGSGKSVSARSVIGLLPETALAQGVIYLSPDKGDGQGVDVLGLDDHHLRSIRGQRVSMVFQEPLTALDPVYTVGWQIGEVLRAHTDLTKQRIRERVIDIMTKVGIPDPEQRVDWYPHQFSGGQRQRIVIALALVMNPKLIIADEPTTALDVTVQAEILDLLRRCRDVFHASVIIITHNMGVVAALADRVVVMHDGVVVEEGDVFSLFAHPKDPYTQQLLAAVPRIGRTQARVLPEEPRRDEIVLAKDMKVVFPGGFRKKDFTAVDGISLTIRKGEVLGLAGESGSGKTTTGRAIAGLVPVSSGYLSVLGFDLSGLGAKEFDRSREEVGFVFQDPASSFNPRMKIGECLSEPFLIHRHGMTHAQRKAQTEELLDMVRLPKGYISRYPHELSGGQRQRIGLARALALRPKLLIADEPTSALDVSVQASILDLFKELQEEIGFACLFITHDLAVVDVLAHRIAIMSKGKIVEQGITREVLTHPTHPYTCKLLESLPVPDPSHRTRPDGPKGD